MSYPDRELRPSLVTADTVTEPQREDHGILWTVGTKHDRVAHRLHELHRGVDLVAHEGFERDGHISRQVVTVMVGQGRVADQVGEHERRRTGGSGLAAPPGTADGLSSHPASVYIE